jgi:carbon-monoxide dehydrogenase large subunit
MSAIVKALDKVEAKAKKVAGYMMEASADDIEFKDGKFTVAGTDKSAAWGDVALNAYIAHKFAGADLEPGLKEGAFYDPTNFTFPAGCHICEVEIDPETGATEIAAWTAVDDFGTVINPMIVEGQVHGGIAQGVGQALLEGVVYDKDGQLVTGSYMDYTMPRAHDLPSFNVGMTTTKCPSNPLGIKGCGEAGAIAAPAAVINAITDAIGSEDIAMPATSAAVWAAIQRANGARKAAE